jgi:2-polyprenyl-6-hydroxyphenyl methylase/3-demethylubiquinone-9 3-methyltransferase
MSEDVLNVDPLETEKFNRLASQWWDPDGECRPLHDINPSRLEFIRQRAPLKGARVLDVGCGGGLLSEALAREGAEVVGIDLAQRALNVARMHALGESLKIEYLSQDVESMASASPEAFDVVCCLELIEHVPDPASLVQACSTLAKPGGHVFFSTVNRNPLAFAGAIVAAEYLLGLLPRGTHRYERFIRPSELAHDLRASGLVVRTIMGLHYNPLSRTVKLGGPPWINYLVHAQKCV